MRGRDQKIKIVIQGGVWPKNKKYIIVVFMGSWFLIPNYLEKKNVFNNSSLIVPTLWRNVDIYKEIAEENNHINILFMLFMFTFT